MTRRGPILKLIGPVPRCLQYLRVPAGTRIISATSFNVNTFSTTPLLTHGCVTAPTPISTEGGPGWTGWRDILAAEQRGSVPGRNPEHRERARRWRRGSGARSRPRWRVGIAAGRGRGLGTGCRRPGHREHHPDTVTIDLAPAPTPSTHPRRLRRPSNPHPLVRVGVEVDLEGQPGGERVEVEYGRWAEGYVSARQSSAHFVPRRRRDGRMGTW